MHPPQCGVYNPSEIGSRKTSSRRSPPAFRGAGASRLFLHVHPSGCPFFIFSSGCFFLAMSCSLPLLLLGLPVLVSAAVSCAAAGSGSLIGVELCAGGKGKHSWIICHRLQPPWMSLWTANKKLQVCCLTWCKACELI